MQRRRAGRSVTMAAIAREAGVSIATVSRALREPDRVAAGTRETVLSVARRHHFVADGLAGGLATRRSRLLGLVIPTILNSVYAASTQAVQEAAQRAGYTTLVCISEFSPEAEARLVLKLIERRVDGLILTGATFPAPVLETILGNHVPVVTTWIESDVPGLPSVAFSNSGGVRLAVEHLARLGHRAIGFVCGRSPVNDRAAARLRSFRATMASLRLEVSEKLILERDFDYSEGYAALRLLVSRAPKPTAVHFANDIQAIGALQACRDMGLRVPEDLSIIGFDDHPAARYTSPQLTTVRVPAADMGRRAAAARLANRSQELGIDSVVLPLDLVVRGSTAPPATVA